MNRYAASGIAQDAREGRRVLVVSPLQVEARVAFDAIASKSTDADRITRANGAESIKHRNGGSVHFITTRSARRAARGRPADVVYIDAGAESPDLVEIVRPCLASSQYGEFIRA